jgi:putative transposase
LARKRRLIGEELYHHVYAWGNDHHPVFKRRSHYMKYLQYAGEYARRYDVDMVAYALMWWHVHLFVFDLLGNLSRFMNSLHGRYAKYLNSSTGRVGHVFGERYNNKVVQANEYGLWLSRYIHRQPVEAGLVRNPMDYEWTSLRAYMGLAPQGFVKPKVILDQFGKGKRRIRLYEEFVTGAEEGPVDWGDTAATIVGMSDFEEQIRFKTAAKKRRDSENVDVAHLVSCDLGVEQRVFLNPSGRDERRRRHRAFAILVNEYGFSLSEIARSAGVSTTAVVKALKD